ncbi:peptidase M30 [Leptospira hartskeerlii]|uniref:Peptidase M30 n=1 Tax=Leptospira hartskeerlii TaxID=2023177 RepID=A0A2M9XB04_9LEPT|nr:peptidase M30 [Leptospira hartskeerlii]PJZ24834.1 peptidase M30 [Leptospira hartskeerlii]PJZ33073.1 peptidase M30 [Leptospira hartskeerlii]
MKVSTGDGFWKSLCMPIGRSLYTFVISFCLIFLLSHCVVSNDALGTQDKTEPSIDDLLSLAKVSSSCGGGNTFWIRNLIKNSSSCVQTTKVASGSHVNIYATSGLESVLDYQYISQEFDSKIYPRLGEAFGFSDDLDGDGKVAVIVSDIHDGSTTGSSFVAGFFDPVDYFPDSSGYAVRSNYSNIVYMDGVELVTVRNSDLSQGKPDTFLATLAHEYQHLIRFQYEARIMSQGGGRDEAWINEGTSEVAADIAGYSPQINRINCYRGRNSNACSRGANGNSIFGSSKFNSLVDYAFAYSFMKYLYMISGSDTDSRNSYFRTGVQGPKGYRASDATGLFHLFKTSADNYINSSQDVKDAVGTDGSAIFMKIYPAFLWQSLGDVSPEFAQSGTDTSGASGFLQDITKTIQSFPFPAAGTDGDVLRKLYDPLRIPEITPLGELNPGQIQFVKADRSNSSAIGRLVLLKKNIDGNLYSLQINTEMKRSGDISVSLGITENDDEGGEEAIVLPESTDSRPICPHEFFKLSRNRTKQKIFSEYKGL